MKEALNEPKHIDLSKVPSWIPPNFVQIVDRFLDEPRKNKWFISIFLIAFVFIVCEFIYDSFAPGDQLLVRQILCLPVLAVCAFGVYRMISTLNMRVGLVPFVISMIGFKCVHALRREKLADTVATIIVEAIAYTYVYYILSDKSSRPSTP